jgi:hypothetical protein
MSKNSLSENVLSDNHHEWLYRLHKSRLVDVYSNDSMPNYRLEVRLLLQFHCEKTAINTNEKPHKRINYKLQSVFKTQKSLDEKTIARTDKNYRRSSSRLAARHLFHRLACGHDETLVIVCSLFYHKL